MKSILLSISLLFSLTLHGQWLTSTPDMPDTVGLWHLDAVDENVAWACALKWTVSNGGYGISNYDKGYFIKTSDGGQNWTAGEVPLGDIPFFSNICGLNADEAWTSGLDITNHENFVHHTTDGGQNWERKLIDGFTYPASYVNFVHFWNDQRGIAVGDPVTDAAGADPYYEIYLTYDGGQNWNRVSPDSIFPNVPLLGEFGLAGYYQVKGNSVWFSTNKNRIYNSTNGGQSWIVQSLPMIPYKFSFADTLFGIVDVGTNYLVTEDGGWNWNSIDSPPLTGGLGSLVAIPQSHYLLAVIIGSPVTGPFTTIISPDKGETWQEIDYTENACVAAFISPTVGYAGEWQPLDHATRMYSYDDDPLTGILSGKPLEAEIAVSPNPVSNLLTVYVKTEQPADILLLLNDINGRLVEQQKSAKTNDWSTSFDLHSLPPGLYILTISTAEGSLTKQVVKQ